MLARSFFLVGEGTLPIRCAEILLNQRQNLLGIISSDNKVKEWCQLTDIHYYSSLDQFYLKNKGVPFDYLISVANFYKLSDTILALPKKYCINCHDALLPRYAGLYSTSWAIYNNEKTHGITWHIMNSKIDTGDILKQKEIDIDPEETALTLNLKCYQATLETFPELIFELLNNTLIPKAQDLKERTYYPAGKKILVNNLIDWNNTAENIFRIFRSHDLGPYESSFGEIKFSLNNEFYAIKDLLITDTESTQSPGTIKKIDQYSVEVSTLTYDVVVKIRKKIDEEATIADDQESKNNDSEYKLDQLIKILKNILSVREISGSDNFFSLGGDSILVMRTIAELHKCGFFLSAKDIFQFPVIVELSKRIKQIKKSCNNSSLVLEKKNNLTSLNFKNSRNTAGEIFFQDSVDSNIKSVYSLSSIQEGMIFHTLKSAQPEVYSVQVHGLFQIVLDTAILQNAWKTIIDRYDILRTSFDWKTSDRPQQVVHFDVENVWYHYNWQGISQEMFDEKIETFLTDDRLRGFDLSKAPLIRLSLISIKKNTYYVVITFHHAIMDGWCIPTLFRELSAVYHSFCALKPQSFTEPYSYQDYVLWLQKKNDKDATFFWRSYLAGFSEPTSFSPMKKTFSLECDGRIDYGTKKIVLSQSITNKVHRLVQEHGTTLNTVFQFLWAFLLSSYSQTNDVIFGLTLSTRAPEWPSSKDLIGVFINTVPFRLKIEKSSSILDMLQSTKAIFSEIIGNHYLPLIDIKNESEIENGIDLFQSVFVFENSVRKEVANSIFDIENINIDDLSHYPIVFYVTALEEITFKINYNQNVISSESADKVIDYLQVLLHQIVDFPNRLVEELTLLTSEEYQKLMIISENSAEKISSSLLPHQLFENQVLKNPNAVALIFNDEQLTYCLLNKKANQLARYLRKQGVGPETLVALFLERGFETVIGVLGILKSGGVYLPIDPAYPDSRIEFILSNSKTAYILSQDSLLNRGFKISDNVSVVSIDSDWSRIVLESEDNLENLASLNNAMYVIYTSGSTGNPKGVILEHRNVLHLFNGVNQRMSIDQSDVWTLFHSVAFDFSVWEIWGALLHGGTLVIVPYLTSRASDEFHALLVKNKVTVLSQTPSAFHQLVLADKMAKETLALRCIVFDGEILPPEIVNLWFESHKENSPILINMYGITETTVHLTYFEVSSEKLIDGIRYSIGNALPGVDLYILDESRQILPQGFPGELYVGGNFLARAYLDDKLTKERFVNVNFKDGSQKRLYKTGDLVRRLEDGNLDYLGRLDNQVKFRGFRIELDEISARIEKCYNISRAMVILNDDKKAGKYLTCYYTTKDGLSLNDKSLIKEIGQNLPEYMIPRFFTFLKKFSLNNNGKINKAELRLMNVNREDALFVSPDTVEEHQLLAIWKDILKNEHLGVCNNFFDSGGNSLIALQMLSYIKRKFFIDLPVRSIFLYPTIKELAEVIYQYRQNKNPISSLSCLVPLKVTGDRAPLFLIHPVGGSVFWYMPLARVLDPRQPLYGIQDPGLENLCDISFSSIEEMASFYIEKIEEIQPHGPYCLGGASGGAIISFEMARQLLQKNETISFVGLLDGWVPHPNKLRTLEFFEEIMRSQFNKLRQKFEGKGIDRAESLFQLQWQRAQLLDNYRFNRIDTKLTLFKAKETISIYEPYEDSFNHWEPYSTEKITRYWVPGDHETMFQEPNTSILGEKVTAALNSISSIKENNIFSFSED